MADRTRSWPAAGGLIGLLLLLPSCTSADIEGAAERAPLDTTIVRGIDVAAYPIVYAQRSSGSQDLDLYLTSAVGDDSIQYSKGRLHETSPAWSPDGSQLAFVVTKDLDNGPSDIYTVEASGENLRLLTTTDECTTNPSWSPDGRSILYLAGPCGADAGSVHVMDSNGDDPRQVLRGPALWPHWSAEGRIVYEGVVPGSSDSALFVTDRTGGDPEVLDTGRLPTGYEATWSPEGNHIAYVAPTRDTGSLCRANEDIFVVPIDGTGGRRVVKTAGNDHWPPAWSPDGRQLLYTADGPPPCRTIGNLMVVDLQTLHIEPLFDEPCQCLFPSWRS